MPTIMNGIVPKTYAKILSCNTIDMDNSMPKNKVIIAGTIPYNVNL